jgi:hypothetical protein
VSKHLFEHRQSNGFHLGPPLYMVSMYWRLLDTIRQFLVA